MLLLVVCIAYVISDVSTHRIPVLYYEGFFTYLYGVSILFLLYVFCFLLQGKLTITKWYFNDFVCIIFNNIQAINLIYDLFNIILSWNIFYFFLESTCCNGGASKPKPPKKEKPKKEKKEKKPKEEKKDGKDGKPGKDKKDKDGKGGKPSPFQVKT